MAVETNDDIADVIREHPDRYRGLAHLPLQDPKASVDELERCVRDLGFDGAIIGTHVDDTTTAWGVQMFRSRRKLDVTPVFLWVTMVVSCPVSPLLSKTTLHP